MNIPPNKTLVLFDGICVLCNASVRFIIKRDKKKRFLFSSLQSDAAKQTLLQYKLKNFDKNSIVVIEQNKVYLESDAIFRILRSLPYPWKALYPLKILPNNLRNSLYRFVARNRYKYIGKYTACRYYAGTADKERFIL